MDTIQAAILLEKLKVFDKELERRSRIADRYTADLKGVVRTPVIPKGYRSSFAQYTIALPDAAVRDRVREALGQAGIPTNIYYPIPLHHQSAFAHYPRCILPNAEEACERVLSLPMHPYLSSSEVDRVCETILETLAPNGENDTIL